MNRTSYFWTRELSPGTIADHGFRVALTQKRRRIEYEAKGPIIWIAVIVLALFAAACGNDTDEPEAEEPVEEVEEPVEEVEEAEEPEAEGSFMLEVNGTTYALPGPPGGILGALPPSEVFLWKYNFDTGVFEQDGDEPAPPFDASPRTATQDWQIGWSNPWAALEFSTLLENSTIRTAEAAGASQVGARYLS